MNTVFSSQISEQFQLCPNYKERGKSKKKLVEGEHKRGLPGDMGTRIWTWTFQSKRESARKPTRILSLCFVRMRTKKKERLFFLLSRVKGRVSVRELKIEERRNVNGKRKRKRKE
ncbi:hypothetical protein AHAS_Ahas16G0123900 [Arachis hypogaea]